MSQENVEIVRRIYEAFNEGDFARAVEPASPDFEFVPDEREIIGVFQGREKVQRYLEDQADVFDENQVQPEEFFDKDDQVIVFIRVRGRGRGSGVELDVRIAHVWTFRAGKPVRCEVFAERDKVLEAAGLSD
jgi:ketosteroid isomerase-like protein